VKICILAPRYPFPEAAGDVLRINHITRYLKKKGHIVCLVSFYEDGMSCIDEEGLYDSIYKIKRSRLTSYFRTICSFFAGKPLQYGYYCSNKFLKLLKRVKNIEKPDLYISHTHRMVWYLEKINVQDQSIIEMSDALSKTYSLVTSSSYNSWKKLAYLIEKKRIVKYERYLLKTYRKIVLVSNADKEYLNNHPSLFVYPNGRDIVHEEAHPYDNNKIVFVGNMRALQNQDAVLYFVEEIFPHLLEKKPDLRFYIIGSEPNQRIRSLDNGKNIFVTGYVEDIYQVVCDACLSVIPIRIAAGLQNKVLEAMSYHIPVVISKLISFGIPGLVNGSNCFIVDDVNEYIDCCLELLENKVLRNNMSNKGFELVKSFYDWNKMLEGYEILQQ
jgi:glycosyltransferase involved in cell wall biosynthesis